MREHGLRRQIIDEMHLRRWPALKPPLSIWQIIRTLSNDEREQERALLERHGGVLQPGQRHVSGQFHAGIEFAWERHTEGSSIAIFVRDGTGQDPIDQALAWIEGMPGMVVRATRIILIADEDAAEKLLPHLSFSAPDLVSCRTCDGMRIWSDFRLHEQDFGKLLVAGCGLDPVTLSRRVQQIQELGNYRNMALLGLPQVREQWAELDAIEERLRRFASAVSDRAAVDDDLMEQVATLSVELATLNNAIGYRLDATKAYASLVAERLEDLAPIAVANFQSLTDFTRRRFLPAVRTCASHGARLDKLTERAADLTALLRARIETRIENQNGQLLASMERRALEQLRLQQVVEGLSVVAIAYYGVGLVAYAAKAASRYWPGLDVELAIGLSIPLVLLATWLGMRIARRVLAGDPRE